MRKWLLGKLGVFKLRNKAEMQVLTELESSGKFSVEQLDYIASSVKKGFGQIKLEDQTY